MLEREEALDIASILEELSQFLLENLRSDLSLCESNSLLLHRTFSTKSELTGCSDSKAKINSSV